MNDEISERESGRIFVGGISWKGDEESLGNYFSSFGKVLECRIIMDKNTKKSKGYGFVTFEDPESAEKVKQANSLYFLGKMMNVGDAVRKDGVITGGSQGGKFNNQGANYGNQTSENQYYGNAQQQQYGYANAQPYGYVNPNQYYNNYNIQNYQPGWQPMPVASTTQQPQANQTQTQQQQPVVNQSNQSPQNSNQMYQNIAALQHYQQLQQLQLQQIQYQRLFLQQNPQYQQLYQQQLQLQQMQLQQGGDFSAQPPSPDSNVEQQSNSLEQQQHTQ